MLFLYLLLYGYLSVEIAFSAYIWTRVYANLNLFLFLRFAPKILCINLFGLIFVYILDLSSIVSRVELLLRSKIIEACCCLVDIFWSLVGVMRNRILLDLHFRLMIFRFQKYILKFSFINSVVDKPLILIGLIPYTFNIFHLRVCFRKFRKLSVFFDNWLFQADWHWIANWIFFCMSSTAALVSSLLGSAKWLSFILACWITFMHKNFETCWVLGHVIRCQLFLNKFFLKLRMFLV